MSIFGTGTPTLYTTDAESSVNFTTNYVVDDWLTTSGAHGLSVGDLLTVSSTGTLPGGLSANYYYSVSEVVSTTEIYVTAEGRNNIALSSDGTGTHSFIAYKTRLELTNFLIQEDNLVERGFWQESVITGHRGWVTKGHHLLLNIRSNIFKEGSAATKFKEIYGYLYTDVYVYKHVDGANLFRDSSGEPVLFNMTDFQTAYVTQGNFKDYAAIVLQSKDYINYEQML